jgi:hypothetical protein
MVEWPNFVLLSGRAVSIVENKRIVSQPIICRGDIYLPFFGLTWNEEKIFLGRRSQEGKNDVVEVYDKQWNRLSVIPYFFSDLHQVHIIKFSTYPKNRVYIVESNTDTIYEWDEHNLYKRFSSNNKDGSYHINSVWNDGQCFWLCCHNWASKMDRSSFFLKLDKDFKIIDKYNYGIDAHNIFIDNTFLYTCSSFEQTFNRLNLNTKESLSIPIAGFTRGLAATQKYFLVGASPKKNHKDRISDSDCRVYLIDRKSFEIVDYINFEKIGLNVDIRIVDDIS